MCFYKNICDIMYWLIKFILEGIITMHWIYLFIAGLFETVWAVGLKYTEGFSKFLPSVITITAMLASFILLSLALKHLPLGSAYAIWTGIGIVGTVILGIILFHEPITFIRLFFISLIIIGVAGLKMITH